MNFFHLIFPCANIFLVLRPPPTHHTFSNGPSVNRLRLSRCATTQKSEETGCKQLTLYKYLTAALRYVSSSVVMGTGNVLASLNSGVLLFCTISVSWSAKSKKRYTTYGLGCIPEKNNTWHLKGCLNGVRMILAPGAPRRRTSFRLIYMQNFRSVWLSVEKDYKIKGYRLPAAIFVGFSLVLGSSLPKQFTWC